MNFKYSYTKYKKLQTENVNFGTNKEASWIDVLRQTYPNIKTSNTEKKEIDYSTFDATATKNGQKFNFELKTRKDINHNTFPSIYIGLNKLKEAKKQLENGVRTIFFWDCVDGLYHWEITNENKEDGSWFFNDDGKEYFIGEGGNSKIGQTPQPVAYIWKDYLKKYN